ncbi:hypothetical protein WJX79_001245 [Trebouxia sp. C0005]
MAKTLFLNYRCKVEKALERRKDQDRAEKELKRQNYCPGVGRVVEHRWTGKAPERLAEKALGRRAGKAPERRNHCRTAPVEICCKLNLQSTLHQLE